MTRSEKVANFIKERAAEFLNQLGNRTSLITVTAAACSPDLKRATVFISVLPENKEQTALEFVRRQLTELRNYLKKSMRTKNVPHLQVQIDQGEKNRQKIDDLLRNG